MSRLLSLPFLALLGSAPAWAQHEPPVDSATTVVPVRYRDVTTVDEDAFEGLDIDGELVRPGVEVGFEVTHKPFPSWIRLRTDFTAEVSGSVDLVR